MYINQVPETKEVEIPVALDQAILVMVESQDKDMLALYTVMAHVASDALLKDLKVAAPGGVALDPAFKNDVLAYKGVVPFDTKTMTIQVAVGETVILLLHPPPPSAGVSIGMERGCQQNDMSLADGLIQADPNNPKSTMTCDGKALEAGKPSEAIVVDAAKGAVVKVEVTSEDKRTKQVSRGLQLHSLWIIPTAAVS